MDGHSFIDDCVVRRARQGLAAFGLWLALGGPAPASPPPGSLIQLVPPPPLPATQREPIAQLAPPAATNVVPAASPRAKPIVTSVVERPVVRAAQPPLLDSPMLAPLPLDPLMQAAIPLRRKSDAPPRPATVRTAEPPPLEMAPSPRVARSARVRFLNEDPVATTIRRVLDAHAPNDGPGEDLVEVLGLAPKHQPLVVSTPTDPARAGDGMLERIKRASALAAAPGPSADAAAPLSLELPFSLLPQLFAKKTTSQLVYRPAEGAGISRGATRMEAGAFGWAVNEPPPRNVPRDSFVQQASAKLEISELATPSALHATRIRPALVDPAQLALAERSDPAKPTGAAHAPTERPPESDASPPEPEWLAKPLHARPLEPTPRFAHDGAGRLVRRVSHHAVALPVAYQSSVRVAQVPRSANRAVDDETLLRNKAIAEADATFKPIRKLSASIRPTDGELPTDVAAIRFAREGQQPQPLGASRPWDLREKTWEAPALCHNPLYFEEVNAERYGYGFGLAQPFASAASFFVRVPALPYLASCYAPHECIYTLGHYLPGDDVPYQIHRFPFRPAAGVAQAGVLTGLWFLIP